jgi:hypothetical protein
MGFNLAFKGVNVIFFIVSVTVRINVLCELMNVCQESDSDVRSVMLVL